MCCLWNAIDHPLPNLNGDELNRSGPLLLTWINFNPKIDK